MLVVLAGLALCPERSAQASQAAAPTPAPAVRVLSTASGTQGAAHNGRYVVLDPRTTFRIHQYPQVGERLSISLINGNASPGAPVINDYGEIVGVVSQGLFPGSDRIQTLTMSTWEFGVPTAESVYRTDVLFGPDVAWRGFFRMVK